MRSKLWILLALIVLSVLIFLTIFFVISTKSNNSPIAPEIATPTTGRVWQFRSIDTMKVSRDQAKKQLINPDFYATVDQHIKDIKNSGSNYVAIGTPYDNEFLPIIKLWVKSARKNGLNVWFRGNFSAWEGWFGYNRNLTRDEHLALTINFISKNPDLFENGDIFTPCPECENGGPGDPRQTDLEGFRNFMINERTAIDREFSKIGKKVHTNFNSMNLDVAKIVYDDRTLKSMNNLIVVDHYVKEPNNFIDHINELAQATRAQIMLGEIGAPVSGIHENMSENEQANWMEIVFTGISKNKNVIGTNWWVNIEGESAIFNSDGKPKEAQKVLEKFYKTHDLSIH